MREQNTSIVPVIQNLDKIISPILSFLVKFDCALMLKRPDNWFSDNCSTVCILYLRTQIFKKVNQNNSNKLSLNH